MQNKAEAIRLDVLRANTAQDVFNVLEQVESLSSKSSDRWLWELVQNAVDAAQVVETGGIPRKETRICITLTGTSLEFSHAGRPFSWEEITHLIYHGSTKLEDETVGRYGTGFITTHVLSRRVRVAGGLGSQESFSFWLDRRGQNWREIKDRMDESWTEFIGSVNHEAREPNLTTYEFPLSEAGRQAAENQSLCLVTSSRYSTDSAIGQLGKNLSSKPKSPALAVISLSFVTTRLGFVSCSLKPTKSRLRPS